MAHRYIIGSYSQGKTSLLVEQMQTSIAQGHGVCFIDPHGLTIPDATIIDPDVTRWNPLAEPIHPALAASLFQDTVKGAWGYGGMTTPVMDMYLFFSAASLIDNGHNLTDVIDLLTDKQYRSVLSHTDTVTRKFWEQFELLNDKDRRQEISSTLNKFFTLLADPRIRRMFGANKRCLSLKSFMDDSVLHVRLPVRLYGKSKVGLVGSLVISYLTQLLLERNSDRPYDLYIDDVHMFAADTVQNALVSTSRYGLSTTVAHQNIAQIDPALFAALMGNCATRHVFRVSKDDAEVLQSAMKASTSKCGLDELPQFSYRTFPFHERDKDSRTLPLES
jgi:hypothetical protein